MIQHFNLKEDKIYRYQKDLDFPTAVSTGCDFIFLLVLLPFALPVALIGYLATGIYNKNTWS